MGKPIYNWIIIYDDGSTEITSADNPLDAIESTKKDWYYEVVRAVIRVDYER